MKNKKILFISIVLSAFMLIGFSYAAYSFTKDSSTNAVTTGAITIKYEDKSKTLTLENAVPRTYEAIKEQGQFGAPAGSMIMDTGVKMLSEKVYYRLKMWVDGSYSDNNNSKTYGVKVNIYGTTEKEHMDNKGVNCTFSDVNISNGRRTDIDLICTDDTTGVIKNELNISDFKIDSDVITLEKISSPIKIANGYKYTLTILGNKLGSFNISLLSGKIRDKLGNKNDDVVKGYEVKDKILTITYNKESYIDSIEKTEDTCIANPDTESCTVILPNIILSAGFTSLGWNTEKDSSVDGLISGSTITLKANKTYNYYVNSIDITEPNISLELEGDDTYTTEKSLLIDIIDEGEGIDSGTLKYGWSSSLSTEPTSYTTG